MERKIGEVFGLNGGTAITEQGENCKDCCFCRNWICRKKKNRDIIGPCSSQEREDKTSVIFREITNNTIPTSKDDNIYGEDNDSDEDTGSDKYKKVIYMKPFDLEAAKAGKPVCTRDGRKARILCFNFKHEIFKIVAAVSLDENTEYIESFTNDGKYNTDSNESDLDLMMVGEKKQGWINIYRDRIYDTCEAAKKAIYPDAGYIKTCLIEWEDRL